MIGTFVLEVTVCCVSAVCYVRLLRSTCWCAKLAPLRSEHSAEEEEAASRLRNIWIVAMAMVVHNGAGYDCRAAVRKLPSWSEMSCE